jgi:hypothetical protein
MDFSIKIIEPQDFLRFTNYFTKEKLGLIWALDSLLDDRTFMKPNGYVCSNPDHRSNHGRLR